jgi:hypothetical protein
MYGAFTLSFNGGCRIFVRFYRRQFSPVSALKTLFIPVIEVFIYKYIAAATGTTL